MARKRHSSKRSRRFYAGLQTVVSIEKAARKAGVHVNTILLWKKKYGELGTAEVAK